MSAAEFSFPMSTSSQYLEAIINITTISSLNYMECKFTESSSETVPDGLNVDGTPITEFLDYGYWTFTPDNGTGVIYDITLTSSGHTNGGTDPAQHAIFKRDGGDWGNIGTHNNNTQSGTGTSPITAKRTNVTGFSDFIIGKSDNPLLTELIEFTANCNNKKVDLKWITASEERNDYFTIEKSPDGINFTYLKRIEGAGNSNQIIEYNYTDPEPFHFITYYSLKQTDFNGISIYSDIISSECNIISFDILGTFINNEDGTIKMVLISQSDAIFYIELFDILGRKISSKTFYAIEGENIIEIKAPSISNEICFITIINNTEKINKKIYIK